MCHLCGCQEILWPADFGQEKVSRPAGSSVPLAFTACGMAGIANWANQAEDANWANLQSGLPEIGSRGSGDLSGVTYTQRCLVWGSATVSRLAGDWAIVRRENDECRSLGSLIPPAAKGPEEMLRAYL